MTKSWVNPARSLSQALFVGDRTLNQRGLIILAPIVGAILSGLICEIMSPEKKEKPTLINRTLSGLHPKSFWEAIRYFGMDLIKGLLA